MTSRLGVVGSGVITMPHRTDEQRHLLADTARVLADLDQALDDRETDGLPNIKAA